MSIELNHTIVYSRAKHEGARFLTDLFGLPAATTWGPFSTVQLSNQVTLDYLDADGEIAPQHYCFLVDEADFDAIFGRMSERGLPHWADPGHRQPNEINTHDGGRGVYFDDPSGHILEIITRPYAEGRG
jgi:catechol 2,3-dioxygenase-like lactoylglutathione lyase family enzyme